MYKKIIWLFIGIASILFFACTAEKDKGDYLKGRVLLDGQPAGGVLVRLYDYPQVNDTLEYLQSQYPGIGVKVTRQLNFDKNALTVIREVYSDKNGNWEMDNLSTGNFAVVYLKDGLCKNQYAVTVATGGSNAGDFNFGKPFIYKNDSTITGTVTWPAGSSVYIEGKIIVDEMASLTVEPGVSIAFSDSAADYPKGELAIYGKAEFVGTEDEFITFSGLGELKNAWNGVKVGERAEGKFRYCAFYNGYGALSYIKAMPITENCLFYNNIRGLVIEINDNGSVSNNSYLYNSYAFSAKPSDSLDYSRNIFYKNFTGIYLIGPSKFALTNSLFADNATGFEGLTSTEGTHLAGNIINNEFIRNKTGIMLSGDFIKIKSNNFSEQKNYDIQIKSIRYSSNSMSSILHNNFLSECLYNVYYAGKFGDLNTNDLLADDNYWNGTTDSLMIADKIYDKTDAGTNAVFTGNILFWPPAVQLLQNTGIFNE